MLTVHITPALAFEMEKSAMEGGGGGGGPPAGVDPGLGVVPLAGVGVAPDAGLGVELGAASGVGAGCGPRLPQATSG
ncbi:MAG: hypothetical protein WA476_18375, partial [Acidobacteriaceae bacterium]